MSLYDISKSPGKFAILRKSTFTLSIILEYITVLNNISERSFMLNIFIYDLFLDLNFVFNFFNLNLNSD